MSSLKEIKTRIGSVKNTLKITSAMKMVASAKLHKAQAAIGALNRQLVAFGKNVVTEYNTITYPLPSGADTFEVEYEYRK